MNYATLMSMPASFDKDTMYFDKEAYKIADNAFRSCKNRSDSADELERKCSIAATNAIAFVLKEVIGGPFHGIDLSHLIGKEIDSAAVGKCRKIVEQLFSNVAQDCETEEGKAARIEWQKRACNILRSYFHEEAKVLGKFIDKKRFHRTCDLVLDSLDMRYLYSMMKGSLCGVIGYQAEQLLGEKSHQD
jgi:hypothetical protein